MANSLPFGTRDATKTSAGRALEEWVYNGAEIDNSKTAWVRDMGEAQNLKLICYLKDRKVGLVEPDIKPPKLSPYPIPRQTLTPSAASGITPDTVPPKASD
jgi:hypothetical protein